MSGSGLTRTVTLSSITGDGTLGITIGAGTASDTAGNLAPTSGASATFAVDNTSPTIAISPPSAAITNGGSVTYTVTYTDANFNSSTLAAGNITLNTTGTANASIGVSGSGLTRTVTLSSITGNGTLGITIAAGTATDLVGNSAPASGASTTFTVDNVAPTISIGPPSATLTNTGPVTYSVTYSDTWSLSSTLAPSNITVNATGTAGCTNLSVTGSGTAWTVTLSNLTGTGTLGITIAAGTATDQAGNTAPGAGPSATFAVDNTAPRLTGGEALYVAQAGNNQVTFYDNLSGTPVNHTFASGLNFALGVAIDPSGYVYASYMGAVNKYTAAGGLVSGFGSGGTVSGLGTEVPGIILNQSGSRLVVPCYGQTLVQALDTTTGAAAAGFTSVAMSLPLIAAYNSSQTFLYLGDNGGALERYSMNGGTGTTISLTGASGSIVGLLFQDDTHLLVANNSGNTVRRFVLSGTSRHPRPDFRRQWFRRGDHGLGVGGGLGGQHLCLLRFRRQDCQAFGRWGPF